MIAAIANRAQRRVTGADATELDSQQSRAARHQIEHIQKRLHRLGETVLLEKELNVDRFWHILRRATQKLP